MSVNPPVVEEIAAVLAEYVERSGLARGEAAARHGQDAARALCHVIGGRQVYIPSVAALGRASRDARIADEFTGRNVNEIAERYGISAIHVYRIVRAQRARARRR